MNESNAYLRTKVMTASPAELRLMLLEGAVKFANQAREGLADKDYEKSFNGFTSCRNIILELVNGIRPEHDPELSERVRSLYMFIYKELFESSHDKDIPRLEKTIKLLDYERETWALLMDKLAKGDSASADTEPSGPIGRVGPGDGHTPLSIQA